MSLILLAGTAYAGSNKKNPKTKKKYVYNSFYHTTEDGEKLAVDLFLPANTPAEKKLPTIFYYTRYVRSIRLKGYARWLKSHVLGQISQREIEIFTSNGYACVIVDARGSGASSGIRRADFSTQEMQDAKEILDWIVGQTWSNGKVGTTGISYVGTTAEMILSTGHPALKACVPRSNIFDIYADITHPGGVRQSPFLKEWSRTTKSLDFNEFNFLGDLKTLLISGINPVSSDKNRRALKKHLSDRKRYYQNTLDAILRISYRDEIQPGVLLPVDTFSIHKEIKKITSYGVPVFRIGGWYDGALSTSLIKGYLNNTNTEIAVIGPWDHGAHFTVSPYAADHRVKENLYEHIVRFFDKYLKEENQETHERKMIYYTVGAERWDTTDIWPLDTEPYQLFFSEESTLTSQPALQKNICTYQIDYAAGTGGGSRWNSQTPTYRYDKYTRYPDRASQTAKNIIFDSPALNRKMHLLGHAQVKLRVRYEQPEGQVFVYLDEIAPDGTVRYITEGMMKVGFQREQQYIYDYPAPVGFMKKNYQPFNSGEWVDVEVHMLPISYEIPEGHRLRVSIAGVDAEHFEMPELKSPTMDLQIGGNKPANIILPLCKKNSFF